MKVGVLALQGAAARHAAMLARLEAESVAVRAPFQLDDVDALIMPGGESTTMSMLLESSGLAEPLADRLSAGMPVLGTCAGMILLASEVLDGREDQRVFGALDVAVRRNAYGPQLASFEADLAIPDVDGVGSFRAVFIRAPVVTRVGEAVEVLGAVEQRPVLCRQGHVLAAAFHPELGDDLRVHKYFLTEVM